MSDKYQPKAQYPTNAFGKTAAAVAQMLAQTLARECSMCNWAASIPRQPETGAGNLMSQLGRIAWQPVQADLEAHGQADQV